MPSLSREEVDRLAALARLELSDAEKDLFARQIGDVLAFVEQVRAVDTRDVPPTAHVSAAPPPLRDDIVRPSLTREAVFDQAPDADKTAGLFKVPRVLGG
ncbi:MAG TPA: Asp-tRNA(Asn)/Glu-tRNA(Gln) amidotransferase subunit GatC [Vicinamibacterales bacterium]|nr:Asp-tRNA(Asn)/Glu-tRNA(Gln) amidotransferase subunit GatC [Vicinamibacterales bacterium]